MLQWALLGIVLAGMGYWFDALKARERALAAGRTACERAALQLLDDTVRCVRLRLARDENGRLHIARTYRFEFSETGVSRRNGSIEVLGGRVESVYMDPYLLQ